MGKKKPEKPWKAKVLTHKQFRKAYEYCWEAASKVEPKKSEDAFLFAVSRHFRNPDLAASFVLRHSALLKLAKHDLLGPYSDVLPNGHLWFHDAALAVAAYLPLEGDIFDSATFVEGLNLAVQSIVDAPPK